MKWYGDTIRRIMFDDTMDEYYILTDSSIWCIDMVHMHRTRMNMDLQSNHSFEYSYDPSTGVITNDHFTLSDYTLTLPYHDDIHVDLLYMFSIPYADSTLHYKYNEYISVDDLFYFDIRMFNNELRKLKEL